MELKNEEEQLVNAVAKYTDYFKASRKKPKLNHALTSPVCVLSDHLNFQFLPVSGSPGSASFTSLQSHLEELPDYETVCTEELQMYPTDYRSKYSLMQTLKAQGLPFPTALLFYSHGNNVGTCNLNFLWKVKSVNESSFTESQGAIEAAKCKIPGYHTRGMRRERFRVFGCYNSSLIPAARRHIYRVFTDDWSCACLCVYICVSTTNL